jgi:hypothetical protein
MKLNLPKLACTGALCAFSYLPTEAGTPLVDDFKGKEPIPEERRISGNITLGYQGSEDLHTGYLDSLTPLWQNPNNVVFYNSRSTFHDNSQSISAFGLVFRHRIEGSDVIVGVNGFYDSFDSAYDHHFDQAGFGFEVLSKWIDARVNYFLPDQKRETINRSSRRETIRDIERGFATDTVRDTFLRRDFAAFEAPLEGMNSEIGFLVPGLADVMELRIFGGYYHYLNPLGDDYDGFKARLEARIRKGVIAEVEYWDDKVLTGGHWTGSVRVTVPFNLFNIFDGRNPFEGWTEAFGAPSGDTQDRMGDMVIRGHRSMTTSSGMKEIGGGSETRVQSVPLQ